MPDNKENKDILVNANAVLPLDKRIDAIFPADLYSRLKDEFQDQTRLSNEEVDTYARYNAQFQTSEFYGFYHKTIPSKLDEFFTIFSTAVNSGIRLDNNTKSKIAMIFKTAMDFNFDFFTYFKSSISPEIWFIVPTGEASRLSTCYLNKKLQGVLQITEIDKLLKLGVVVDNEMLRIFLEKMRRAHSLGKPAILFVINKILSVDPKRVLVTDKELLNTTLFHVLTAENDIFLDAIRYLVARVNINARNENGETYFDFAAKIKNSKIREAVMAILTDNGNYIKQITSKKLPPESKPNTGVSSRPEPTDFKLGAGSKFQTLEQQQMELDSKMFTTNPQLLAEQLVYAIRFGTEQDAIACIDRITERGCYDALFCKVQDILPFEYVAKNKKDLRSKLLTFFPYHQASDNATLMDLVKYRVALNEIINQEKPKQEGKTEYVKTNKHINQAIEIFNDIMMHLGRSDYIAAINKIQQSVKVVAKFPDQETYVIILKGILRNIGVTEQDEKVGDNKVAQENLKALFVELCHCNYEKKYWNFSMLTVPNIAATDAKSAVLDAKAKADMRGVLFESQVRILRPIIIIDDEDPELAGLRAAALNALKKPASKSALKIKP